MSQYKLLYGETANGSFKHLYFNSRSFLTWITVVSLELMHAAIIDWRASLVPAAAVSPAPIPYIEGVAVEK